MEEVLRGWQCRFCGRSNRTVLELDGTAKCEFCRNVTRVQPSRNRGGESPAQLSRFAQQRKASSLR